VRCAYSEAAGVPSTSLRRIALKPNHTTALHTDSAGTALIQCASLSCAEAAGAEISMAAIQSMAKYSSRFKAPPYSSCFRSRPMKVLHPFPVASYPPQPLQDIWKYLRRNGSSWIVCPQVIH
jgi:hypothetical protein